MKFMPRTFPTIQYMVLEFLYPHLTVIITYYGYNDCLNVWD